MTRQPDPVAFVVSDPSLPAPRLLSGVVPDRGHQMTKDTFWDLIDKSFRDVGKDQMDGLSARLRRDRQLDCLLDRLKMLEPEEIVQFQRCLEECVRDAYRWDLWAVAWIVNGGCSDDGFDY